MDGHTRSKRFHRRVKFTAQVQLHMQQSQWLFLFHPKLFRGWNFYAANFEFNNFDEFELSG
jgi:hypothetical protein